MRDINAELQEQLNKAINWTADGKNLNEAEDIINGMLNIDKKSHQLLYYLANLFYKKGYITLAIYIYKLCITCKDKFPDAWNNLGFALKMDGQIPDATEAFKKASTLQPNDADYLMNYGSMFVANGTPDKAIEIFDKALLINKNLPTTLWNKSLALLEKGQYKEGWELYENRIIENKTFVKSYSSKGTPMWDGTKGQTIVVYGEQGIGDQLMWASVLPDVMKDCNVIIDAHSRLFRIFRHSFPNIPVFGTWKDETMHWTENYKIDAAIPIGSLCKFYRNKKEDFGQALPYLIADPIIVKKYNNKLKALGDKLKVGISWKGGIKGTNHNERSIPLREWLPLFDTVDADFISLQYQEDAEKDIEIFHEKYPNSKKIIHWRDTIDDYDETAGLVSNLDFVISVPQSVVHLAGGLGIPTFQLTPKRAMWQMGVYGQHMPWYSFVRNIWQDDTHTWKKVINKAKEEICCLYLTATETN